MLKLIFMVVGLFFLFFKKNSYWMVQNMVFLMFFICVFFNFYMNIFKVSYFMGMDLISYGLVMLSFWITGLMIMSSEKIYKYKKNMNLFMFLVLFLLFMLVLSFSSMNLFLFYLFFESSLIPIFFLILGWGYQPERLQAGVYLLFYTLFASLPLLVGILFCKNDLMTMNYYMMNVDYNSVLIYFCLILAFLVKMPMFFIHLWLPKAHVEAPVSGSMILAGVLLKLGGYGLLRILGMIQTLSLKYNIMFYVISLVGGVLMSLVCLMQVDMKSLIAYSSVVHMGIVISGLLTLSIWGVLGAYILMIGHGLCSSGLFCLSNILYERTMSRSLFINKGLMNFMPSLSLWWFLLVSSNMAAPPSFNLVGEIILLNSIISWSWVSMLAISLVSFFSAAYSLFMYSISQHGNLFSLNLILSNSLLRENLIMMLHWLPLNILILKADFFMFWM